jgi:hypothetical protein
VPPWLAVLVAAAGVLEEFVLLAALEVCALFPPPQEHKSKEASSSRAKMNMSSLADRGRRVRVSIDLIGNLS